MAHPLTDILQAPPSEMPSTPQLQDSGGPGIAIDTTWCSVCLTPYLLSNSTWLYECSCNDKGYAWEAEQAWQMPESLPASLLTPMPSVGNGSVALNTPPQTFQNFDYGAQQAQQMLGSWSASYVDPQAISGGRTLANTPQQNSHTQAFSQPTNGGRTVTKTTPQNSITQAFSQPLPQTRTFVNTVGGVRVSAAPPQPFPAPRKPRTAPLPQSRFYSSPPLSGTANSPILIDDAPTQHVQRAPRTSRMPTQGRRAGRRQTSAEKAPVAQGFYSRTQVLAMKSQRLHEAWLEASEEERLHAETVKANEARQARDAQIKAVQAQRSYDAQRKAVQAQKFHEAHKAQDAQRKALEAQKNREAQRAYEAQRTVLEAQHIRQAQIQPAAQNYDQNANRDAQAASIKWQQARGILFNPQQEKRFYDQYLAWRKTQQSSGAQAADVKSQKQYEVQLKVQEIQTHQEAEVKVDEVQGHEAQRKALEAETNHEAQRQALQAQIIHEARNSPAKKSTPYKRMICRICAKDAPVRNDANDGIHCTTHFKQQNRLGAGLLTIDEQLGRRPVGLGISGTPPRVTKSTPQVQSYKTGSPSLLNRTIVPMPQGTAPYTLKSAMRQAPPQQFPQPTAQMQQVAVQSTAGIAMPQELEQQHTPVLTQAQPQSVVPGEYPSQVLSQPAPQSVAPGKYPPPPGYKQLTIEIPRGGGTDGYEKSPFDEEKLERNLRAEIARMDAEDVETADRNARIELGLEA